MRPIATDVARSVVCVSVIRVWMNRSRCRSGGLLVNARNHAKMGSRWQLRGVTNQLCGLLPNYVGHLLVIFVDDGCCADSASSVQRRFDGHGSIFVDPTQQQMDPTKPTFRNTVLRKDTVNTLGYNLQYEPRCPKCLTARAARCV